MPSLGSALDPGDPLLPKGPDLHAAVMVPPEALGHAPGAWVRIPRELPGGGRRHPRVPHPADRGDEVRLHLPEGLPDGATLRLCGQGAALDGGRPGDLLVKVQVRPGRLDETWVGLAKPEVPAGLTGAERGAWLVWVGLAVGLALVGLAAWALRAG